MHERVTRQDALTAETRDVPKQLVNITEAARLSTVLRLTVQQCFGIHTEKLVELNLQPFRVRKPVDAQKGPRKKAPDGPARLPVEPTL